MTAPPTPTCLYLRRCFLPLVRVGGREGKEGIGNARRKCKQTVTDGMRRAQVTGTDTVRVISVTPRLISALLAAAGTWCALLARCMCCPLEVKESPELCLDRSPWCVGGDGRRVGDIPSARMKNARTVGPPHLRASKRRVRRVRVRACEHRPLVRCHQTKPGTRNPDLIQLRAN
jgi:hypothetical protein